jgi:ABC-2 type transport system permease protein
MSGAVDVFTLTVRQLAGRRRLWLVLALVSLPVLAGVLFTLADATATPAEFADDITRALVVSTILPLVMLLLGTAALGNEVADRTLVYLVTKPLPRWSIAVPKLVAAVAVGGLPVALSAALAIALIQQGDAGGAAATGAGVLAGAAAYGAIFTWAGLATRHALVLGLGYVFVWEAALAAYLDGIRFLSVRRFTLALVHGLDEARLARIDASPGAAAAAVAVAVVLVGFTALAVRKLRRMDVP